MAENNIIEINNERYNRLKRQQNPLEGEPEGEYFVLRLSDAPLSIQKLSTEWVEQVPLVQLLNKHKCIGQFICKELKKRNTPTLRRYIWQKWVEIRIRYDFCFWAAMFVTIKDKTSGRSIPFVLNPPQKKLLWTLEQMRKREEPIRLILLKARQWGGSTLVQIYMAWIQLVHKEQWNSVICAHLKDSAANIRGMYSKLLESYPPELLRQNKPLKFRPFERTGNTSIISERGCKVTIGSAESPDSLRGTDTAMAHLSEVAFWGNSARKSAELLIRSVCGSIALEPMTVIVLESTANGTGNYFHHEWLRSKRGDSDKVPLFIAWWEIPIYTLPVSDPQTLFDSLSDYEKRLWEMGACLESIQWYRSKRKEYAVHADMMAEYPSDDVEAFAHSGERVFSLQLVDRLRQNCILPKAVGEIYGQMVSGARSLTNLSFQEESGGLFHIWSFPQENPDYTRRYLVAVDIGGRSKKADYSVIVVFDRYWMAHGGVPEVVAQWRGHIDHDLLAWKAAQIASFYQNALLVIESNTFETENMDGEGAEYILDTLSNHYSNLYARPAKLLQGGNSVRWGFHVNRSTKHLIVSHQVRMVRENGYIERDVLCCNEHDTYERKANGGYGAIDGCHDDLLMTRCFGLYICYEEPIPRKR